ncbi:MAG: carbonic anhydrase [Acidimicrobiales bacterium]|nr:carbonic anhydrase [Acidimicrobiales bacterium]
MTAPCARWHDRPVPSFRTIRDANRRYAEHFHDSGLDARPTRHLVILTCMDARIDLFRAAGLEIGDAHLLRNAGGRVTDDAIRSMVLSAHLLGTREFVVIHHTGCGLAGRTNDELRALVAARTGADASDMDFLPFDDLEASVRADVARLRSCRLLPADASIWGAVFDVHTGLLGGIDRSE